MRANTSLGIIRYMYIHSGEHFLQLHGKREQMYSMGSATVLLSPHFDVLAASTNPMLGLARKRSWYQENVNVNQPCTAPLPIFSRSSYPFSEGGREKYYTSQSTDYSPDYHSKKAFQRSTEIGFCEYGT